jgi:hypothetical protein
VPALCPAKVTSSLHRLATECLLGNELVVGATANPEVSRVVVAAEGAGIDVVELEERARVAAATVG